MRNPTKEPRRRFRRSFGDSSSLRSPDSRAASRPSSAWISIMETEMRGYRQSRGSSSGGATSASGAHFPGPWVILNRVGGRKDRFSVDRTTSSISYTSAGEEISVSFEHQAPESST